ncbi:MAG: hypothetical protein RIC89_05195, partial [Pseudomonadales bacterium]
MSACESGSGSGSSDELLDAPTDNPTTQPDPDPDPQPEPEPQPEPDPEPQPEPEPEPEPEPQPEPEPEPQPEPEPEPEQPTVSLRTDVDSVESGGSVVLTWSSNAADSCSASGGWSGNRATQGQQTVGPLTSATTFTLNCSGA